MRVLGDLKTALKSVCTEVAMDVYDGKADTYIVYNVAAEQPGGFADDNPAVNEMYFQVHLFVPLNKNYLNMQKAIKTALFLSGFSYPKVALNTVERDVKKRHICYETNIAESEV